MSGLMDTLASKIPDFKEIVDIFNGMIAQHNEDTAHIEDTRKTYVYILSSVTYYSHFILCTQVFRHPARSPLQIPKEAEIPRAGVC